MYQHFTPQSEGGNRGTYNPKNHSPKKESSDKLKDTGPRKYAMGTYNANTGDYTIAPNDNLSGISLRFNLSLSYLQGIAPAVLLPGQSFRLSSPQAGEEDRTEEARKKAKELAADKGGEKAGELLEEHANEIIKHNQETGKAIDNFGKERYVRPYKDATAKKMNGLDPNINMGGKSARGIFTTSHPDKYLSKSARMFKTAGKNIAEFAGPLVDAILFTQVVQGKESPFVILNPISFVMDDITDQMDRDLLDHAIKAGYESTHSIITNSRHYGDYQMINCTAEQFIEIMNGDISKYSQIVDANQRGVGFAVLVQRKGPDSFIPVAGFNIPNK